MRCDKCGADVDAKSLFCPQCGNQLSTDSAGEPDAEPTARDRFRYAASNRQQGSDLEQPLWQGSYSPKAMIGSWIAAGVATLAAIVCGFMFLQRGQWWFVICALLIVWAALAIVYLYRRFSVKYTLTNQRLIHESGLLWRVTDRVELIDVDDIRYSQGPVARIFNFGTIDVFSSDKSHGNDSELKKLPLPGIDDVRTVAEMIDRQRREERRRRGVHIEQV